MKVYHLEVKEPEMNKIENIEEKLNDSLLINLLLGSAPFTGGLINALNLRVNQRKDKRLKKFLLSLSSKMENLDKTKLPKEYIQSEEFWNQIEFVCNEVRKTEDQKKIRYLEKYIINSIRELKPDISIELLFQRYLSQLSGSHLVILEYYHKKQSTYSLNDRTKMPSSIDGVLPLNVNDISKKFEHFSWHLIQLICVDLENHGLLFDWSNTHPEISSSESFSLTENALHFMRFLNNKL